MTRNPARRRPAFSLVELLVVISIIGVMLALSATAVFGVRRNQQKDFSAATLTKLDVRIQDKVKKITDQINSDVTNNAAEAPTVLSAVGGNKDVAKAVMLYARLRQQMPMTFAEAKSNFPVCGHVYKSPAAFASLPAVALADPYEESAACFYAAVAADGLTGLDFQEGKTTGGQLPVFLDGFSTPIAFVRLGYDGNANELNPTTPAFDPFYPAKQGAGYRNLAADYDATRGAGAFYTEVWQHVRPNAVTTTPTTALTWVPASLPPGNWNSYPGAKSHKTFVFSAGPNKEHADTNPAANLYGGDNLLSYRLRREGAKGD